MKIHIYCSKLLNTFLSEYLSALLLSLLFSLFVSPSFSLFLFEFSLNELCQTLCKHVNFLYTAYSIFIIKFDQSLNINISYPGKNTVNRHTLYICKFHPSSYLDFPFFDCAFSRVHKCADLYSIKINNFMLE